MALRSGLRFYLRWEVHFLSSAFAVITLLESIVIDRLELRAIDPWDPGLLGPISAIWTVAFLSTYALVLSAFCGLGLRGELPAARVVLACLAWFLPAAMISLQLHRIPVPGMVPVLASVFLGHLMEVALVLAAAFGAGSLLARRRGSTLPPPGDLLGPGFLLSVAGAAATTVADEVIGPVASVLAGILPGASLVGQDASYMLAAYLGVLVDAAPLLVLTGWLAKATGCPAGEG